MYLPLFLLFAILGVLAGVFVSLFSGETEGCSGKLKSKHRGYCHFHIICKFIYILFVFYIKTDLHIIIDYVCSFPTLGYKYTYCATFARLDTIFQMLSFLMLPCKCLIYLDYFYKRNFPEISTWHNYKFSMI